MSDNAIHLLFSSNRWESAPAILKHLESGTTVICDRYAYSGVAFTSAKNNPAAPYEWCKSPDAGLPLPDAVVFLTVSEDVQALRGGMGEERYETTELQRSVRGTFKRLQDDDENVRPWTVVDADGTVEEVTEKVGRVVMDAVERVRRENPTVKKLWMEGDCGGGVGMKATLE